MEKYVSNIIDMSQADKGKFNLIVSGTGTGKTFFIANNIHEQLPDVANTEILFVASRSLIVDQQANNSQIVKFNRKSNLAVEYWSGMHDTILQTQIQIMTYDKIIDILLHKNYVGLETLSKVKVIVFDECHTLFSDKFIANVEALKLWIRDMLYNQEKIILGMTATSGIIDYYKNMWGVSINVLNENPLVRYKAKQLICTNFDTIPYLLATKLEGRSLVLCYSYRDCLKLQDQIPNSFILVSKQNENFTEEMEQVRNYIIENENVPEYYIDADGNKKIINVLLTTSTMREGINLRENGGVKNIISCFSDELHVVQIAGRARYDLDCLVVADTYVASDNLNRSNYLSLSRQEFKDFMQMKTNLKWFMQISHIVNHPATDTLRIMLNKQEEQFIEYLNKRWLVPKTTNDLSKYRIYKEEDKQEIIDMAIKTKILNVYPSQMTFLKVLTIIKNGLGYTVESKQFKIDRKNVLYKLIIDFDETKIDYEYLNNPRWNKKSS